MKRGVVIKQPANPNFRAVIHRVESGVIESDAAITIVKAGVGFTPTSGVATFVGVAFTTSTHGELDTDRENNLSVM